MSNMSNEERHKLLNNCKECGRSCAGKLCIACKESQPVKTRKSANPCGSLSYYWDKFHGQQMQEECQQPKLKIFLEKDPETDSPDYIEYSQCAFHLKMSIHRRLSDARVEYATMCQECFMFGSPIASLFHLDTGVLTFNREPRLICHWCWRKRKSDMARDVRQGHFAERRGRDMRVASLDHGNSPGARKRGKRNYPHTSNELFLRGPATRLWKLVVDLRQEGRLFTNEMENELDLVKPMFTAGDTLAERRFANRAAIKKQLKDKCLVCGTIVKSGEKCGWFINGWEDQAMCMACRRTAKQEGNAHVYEARFLHRILPMGVAGDVCWYAHQTAYKIMEIRSALGIENYPELVYPASAEG